MYPISLPTLAFIVCLITFGITLLLYRQALVRHGLRPTFGEAGRMDSVFDMMVQEGVLWARDLFSRQPLRELENYRVIILVLMAATIATLGVSVILG